MSEHDHRVFDPECKGCRPCIADPRTMKPLPADHPMQVLAESIWDNLLTRSEQESLHRVWIHNSRKSADLYVVKKFQRLMEKRDPN